MPADPAAALLLPPPASFVNPAAAAPSGVADSAWAFAELARLQRAHAGERASFAQQMQVYRDTINILIDEKAELQRSRLKTGEQLSALQHRLAEAENALLVCLIQTHTHTHT